MNDMHEVWHHAQLAARGRWRDVDTPAGPVKAMLPPGMPESFLPRMDPIPAVGQHTDAILAELGYDADAITRLRAEKAI
jgi:crotonobetainyl-CoA:carnitine CoA-transferase CaiB-like acyl-CoA transferase